MAAAISEKEDDSRRDKRGSMKGKLRRCQHILTRWSRAYVEKDIGA
jgi:hypothetical protein